MKKIFALTILSALVFSASLSLAQDDPSITTPSANRDTQVGTPSSNRDTNVSTPGGIDLTLPSPLKEKTVEGLIGSIAKYMLQIAVPLATVMIIYGAFQILVAGGSPENIEKGKKTILYAVIGLGIVLLAWIATAAIEEIIRGKGPAPTQQILPDTPLPPGTREPGFLDRTPGA